MDKKQKENIKRIIGEGLSLILGKLKISKPSAKLEHALKKHTRKLADQFKTEVKRLGKRGDKKIAKKNAPKAGKEKRAGTTKKKTIRK